MTDEIISGLREVLADSMAQGDDDGTSRFSVSIKNAIAEIERLRATIEQLRLVAGPVSIDAVKFADIKKFAKNPVLGEFTDGK